MALYLNRVTLIGNLGQDPQVFNGQGYTLYTFSVATSRSYRDNNTGEWVNATDWHRCVVFLNSNTPQPLAQAIQNIRKGSYVYVEGSLRNRKYMDQATNTERNTIEISVENLHILERQNFANNSNGFANQNSFNSQNNRSGFNNQNAGFNNGGFNNQNSGFSSQNSNFNNQNSQDSGFNNQSSGFNSGFSSNANSGTTASWGNSSTTFKKETSQSSPYEATESQPLSSKATNQTVSKNVVAEEVDSDDQIPF
ncbi:hypothetical protein CKF54_06800 [Psittacicella hinzii]|uniref:Single-stranded DNA-binding protein n=1 Tax=Psittacicella hinzii TaxID=2028575 RepID=A0A3A1Y2C4_9GAMM|nr:single-stranded DNA-binding protein [Psittacicella hinzii]RIY31368.1 hypothetical protein CKF54_06800 [Psittacicella hinzii]